MTLLLLLLCYRDVTAQRQSGQGREGCPCIRLPSSVERINSTGDLLFPGYLNGPKRVLYPHDYGASCKKHIEPGSPDCFNGSSANVIADGATVPWVSYYAAGELPPEQRASWCDQPWCYVDPSNCDTDIGYSSVWPANITTTCEIESEARCALAYSYSTCGSSNTFAEKSYVTASRRFMQLKLTQVTSVYFSHGHRACVPALDTDRLVECILRL